MKIHIETNRLILRDLEDYDARGIFQLDSDPEVHRYLGNNPITKLEEAEKVISMVRKQYKETGIGRWAIVDRANDEFIGWAGLKVESKVRKGISYYDLGYRLKSKYWGKGIGTEVAYECLKFGFEELKFKQICAAAHVDNLASNKILTKTGFQFVEIFEYHDSNVNWYTLDREDFIGLKD